MCLYTLITILGTIKIIKDTWVSKQAIYSTETVYMYIHILYIHILSSVLITDREAQMWNLSFLKMIWVCIYICKYTYVHINSELEIDIKIWAFLYFKLHWHISQEKNMMTLKSVVGLVFLKYFLTSTESVKFLSKNSHRGSRTQIRSGEKWLNIALGYRLLATTKYLLVIGWIMEEANDTL